MGFGQSHGAGETAFHHRAKKLLLECIAGEIANHIAGGTGQERINGGAGVDAGKHPGTGGGGGLWQLHAALFEARPGGQETSFDISVKCFFDLRAHDHFAIDKGGLFPVGQSVVVGKLFLGQFFRRIQRRLDGFTAVLAETGAAQQRIRIQHLEELEAQITAIKNGDTHRGLLFLSCQLAIALPSLALSPMTYLWWIASLCIMLRFWPLMASLPRH